MLWITGPEAPNHPKLFCVFDFLLVEQIRPFFGAKSLFVLNHPVSSGLFRGYP